VKALKGQLMQSKLSVLMPSIKLSRTFWGSGGAEISLGAAAPWPPWNRPWLFLG